MLTGADQVNQFGLDSFTALVAFMISIAESWRRIIDWYAANTPEGSLNLSKGASKKAIAEVETAIGMSFPDDLKESYRLHNGHPDLGGVFSYGRYLLTLEEVAKEW